MSLASSFTSKVTVNKPVCARVCVCLGEIQSVCVCVSGSPLRASIRCNFAWLPSAVALTHVCHTQQANEGHSRSHTCWCIHHQHHTLHFYFIYTHIYTSSSEIGRDIDFLLEEGWGQNAHLFIYLFISSLMSTKSTIKGKLALVSSSGRLGPCLWVWLLDRTNHSHLCLQWQWGRLCGQSQQCALGDNTRTKNEGLSAHECSLLHIFNPVLGWFPCRLFWMWMKSLPHSALPTQRKKCDIWAPQGSDAVCNECSGCSVHGIWKT